MESIDRYQLSYSVSLQYSFHKWHDASLFAICLGLLIGFNSTQGWAQQQGKERITVEHVWKEFRFYSRPAEKLNWMEDDQSISMIDEQNNIKRFSILNPGEPQILIPGTDLQLNGKKLAIASYKFSEDERKVLVLTDRRSIYRHSATYTAYVYDRDARKLIGVAQGAPVQTPTLSPDGRHVAYVQANNILVQELETSQLIRVTSDGQANQIINGVADWVYEEEFTLKQAFEWSPDSRFIAYYRFDERRVPEFTLFEYPDSTYPAHYRYKYPKAGEANSVVQIFAYDLERRVAQQMNIGEETDQYIARIKWTPEGNQLAMLRLNRLQNQIDVIMAEARTGASQILLAESTPTYISEVDDHTLTFLPDRKGFIWQSERDGFNHLYHYGMDGQLKRQLTQGKWEVSSFYGIDSRTQFIYYQSTQVSSIERHIYSQDFESGAIQQLSHASGWHDAEFSNDFGFYIKTYSSAALPPLIELYRSTGERLMALSDNSMQVRQLNQYAISPKEFFEFKTSDGYTLNGYRMKPLNIKKKEKLPVLMFVYGGPGSQQVMNKYDALYFFWFQTLVQQGYMVVCVDNRGTGGKGEAFKKCTYGQLGHFEARDQIEVARWLQSQPHVDPQRIGIWGWSFGGYLSSLCLFLGNDVFKTAAAVAPVTNWRYYDTIYTERFLKTPQENASGYDNNSPLTYADRLKGNYLIVHGLADDNVHPQNAMQMIKKLVQYNKQFEVMLYPDQNHGIGGGNARFHVFNTLTDFFLRKL